MFFRTILQQTKKGGKLSAVYMRRQRAADLGSRSYQEQVILHDETIPMVNPDDFWQEETTVEETMEEVDLVDDCAAGAHKEE